jgi:hypothetical protein
LARNSNSQARSHAHRKDPSTKQREIKNPHHSFHRSTKPRHENGTELKLPNPQLGSSDPVRVTPNSDPNRCFRPRIRAPLRPNSEADTAPASGDAAIGCWPAIAGRGRAARGVGSRRRDWVGGGELSPLLLLRTRGRGGGGSDRTLLLLLPSGSTRCCSYRGRRRGGLSRDAPVTGSGRRGFRWSSTAPAPAAAGLLLRRRRWWWWCEVAGCCWVGLGVGAAAVLRSVSVSMLLYLFALTRLPSSLAAVSFLRFFLPHFGSSSSNLCPQVTS